MDDWARALIHYRSRFVFTVVALLSIFTLVEKRARFPFPLLLCLTEELPSIVIRRARDSSNRIPDFSWVASRTAMLLSNRYVII